MLTSATAQKSLVKKLKITKALDIHLSGLRGPETEQ
jgi:hypothetical protein